MTSEPAESSPVHALDSDEAFARSEPGGTGCLAILLPLSGLAAVWTVAIVWWPTLPASIPLHFDAAGVPDRWGPSSAGNWFLMPAIATFVTALVLAIAWALPTLARRVPELVNVPQKRRWKALDAETRVKTLLPMRWLLVALAIAVQALFLWVVWATRWVAMDPDPANPTRTLGGTWVLFVLGGGVVVCVVAASLWMAVLVKRADRSSESAAAAA